MPIATGINGTTTKREGFGVSNLQMANPNGYGKNSPPTNKGYTISRINSLYENRLNRPRYYTSTPSGLPY